LLICSLLVMVQRFASLGRGAVLIQTQATSYWHEMDLNRHRGGKNWHNKPDLC